MRIRGYIGIIGILGLVWSCRATPALEAPKPMNTTTLRVELKELPPARRLSPAASVGHHHVGPIVIIRPGPPPRTAPPMTPILLVINDTLLHLPGENARTDSLVSELLATDCPLRYDVLGSEAAVAKYGQRGQRGAILIWPTRKDAGGACLPE